MQKKTGNKVILQSVDFSISSLQSGSSREVINRCKIIAATAQANLAYLTDYKVTATDITALHDAINNAIPKAAPRDAAGAERRGITLTLPALFSDAGEEANDLDDLVEGLIDNEDFVTGYFVVRRINDMRGGKSKKEEKEEIKR